jgi:glutamate formiminotransferase/formiminotetrahydrofolate cyclodeaminase
MVANLTTRNQAYAKVRDEMCDIAVKGQDVKDRLCRLADEDTASFNKLLEAMRLPKNTDEEAAARDEAIQNATKYATMIPFTVMEQSLEAIHLAKKVAESGMKASASDGGVAAHVGRAGVEGAWLNVKINVPSITDEAWVADLLERGEALVAEARTLADEVQEIVLANIG